METKSSMSEKRPTAVVLQQESAPGLAPGWPQAGLALAASVLVLLFTYHDTYGRILYIWLNNGTFAHGGLIPFIVAFLIWRRRGEVLSVAPQPCWVALTGLFGAALIWLLGNLVDAGVVQQFAVVAMLPLLVLAVLGRRIAWLLLFPLAYLFFGVPFGEFLVSPLQDFTAAFTVKALRLTGIPVYWEGRFFYLPSGTFEVAKACSGVRYLIASLALGTLYAYLNYRSVKRRLVFVGLSIVLPIVANGFRAYGIVLIADLSDYTLAVGVDHILYGWVFFGIVMFLLFWLGSLFHEAPADSPDTAKVLPQADRSPAGSGAFLASAALAALLGGSGMVLAQVLKTAPSTEGELPVLALPQGEGAWQGPQEPGPAWQPVFHGADRELRGSYRADGDGEPVEVYIAWYQDQHQGKELVNVMNKIHDAMRDRVTPLGLHQFRLSDGRQWPVYVTEVLDDADTRRRIWYWYEVDGQATTSPVRAKLYELIRRLRGGEQGSAVIAVATEGDLDASQADTRLADFLGMMLPSLRAAVRGGDTP